MGLAPESADESLHDAAKSTEERKQLAALAFVCDEIWTLERFADDAVLPALARTTATAHPVDLSQQTETPGTRLASHDAARVGKRLASLLKNLILQLSGVASSSRPLFPRLEDAAPVWAAIGDGCATLASLDALAQPSRLFPDFLSSEALKSVGAKQSLAQSGAKVVRRWMDEAATPKDALRACCLYLALVRVGGLESDAAALFSRAWALQSSSAPIIPVRGRKAIRLDELLALAKAPTSTARKPSNPPTARAAAAAQFVAALPAAARRMAREAATRPTLELATRAPST